MGAALKTDAQTFTHGEEYLEQQFASGSYEIKQPYIQILQEGYDIMSSDGSEVYEAFRPRSLARQFFARVGGAVVLCAVMFGLPIFGGIALNNVIDSKENPVFYMFFVGLSFVAAIFAYLVTVRYLGVKRELTVHLKRSADKKQILKVTPTSSMFFFNHEYQIQDGEGTHMATFKKNIWESMFRRKWHCHAANGNYLYSAIEDSLILALLRRGLGIGKFIPMHFKFEKQGGKPFGQFKRRYSLKDKYQLSHDPGAIPSWLVVATALLLDTGEER